ncbi:hypothetical protein GCM10010191_07180 [Actinomadura vinacea]|uniref:Fatty acyl-AMP ligase n=1 Tax=Actinomadura vinacea TaxID=115336 RepID=A0ABN3IFV6_9ACTN
MDSAWNGETLPARLREVAAAHAAVSARFWTESETITYRELDRDARSMAGALAARGVGRGEPVGILCPNAPEFLVGLFAVLAAGGAAAPMPLPMGAGGHDRLAAIAEAAGMRRVIVSHRFGAADTFAGLLPGVEAIETSARPDDAGSAALPAVGPDDLAIVQFTSGSTARPKGVRLTHRNVMSGLTAISEGIGLGPGDGGGFWLPLFHDMGLFGTLSAVFAGIPAHIWSPLSFVKNPARWLREFAASGATISAMPNFGYDQLLGAVLPDEAAELDLRHWRISFNGAEPISHGSVQSFLDRFAPAGFAPEAMFGVYGMAEATLAVTFPPLGRAPLFEWVDRAELTATGLAVPVARDAAGARAIAGVGRPVAGVRLRITDPDTGTDRPDGEVGEILIQGAPVTPGYLPAPTADDFADGWLRTGDLGYRRGDEVFVTGRRKEMIIVRGANVYPQDVEAVAREVPGVFRRRCVAVAAPDGSESMLVIAESTLTGAEADALRAGLAARIGTELGLAAVTVHLVPPRSIPRTSSGKVRRLAARDLLVPVP